MIESFESYLEHSGLLPEGSKLVVACSGGVDSVVLTHVLHDLGYELVLAHMNYHLRGADSDEDARFVEALAKTLKVACFVESGNAKATADASGEGLQAAARRLRYAFFERIRTDVGADFVVTAHQRDDLIETYFGHLLRGSHWKGFTAIPRVNGEVVRPLLHVSRQEIETYAAQSNIAFRHDASNDSLHYTRNRIRHELIPLLEDIRPGFTRNTLRQIDQFIEIGQVVDGLVAELADQMLDLREEGLRIDIEGLGEHPLLRLLLQEILNDYGFPARRVDEVIDLMYADSGRGIYSSTHRILRERDHLLITPIPEQRDEQVEIYRGDDEVHSLMHLIVDELPRSAVEISSDPNEAILDAELLTFPLVLRRWQAGDRIRPIGLQGSMKVSDLLTQAKLSTIEKERVCVLLSGDELVWVPGFRIGEAAKIGSSTQVVIRFRRVVE
jgi:tRNA(Ile)-lysidine synthase